MMVIAVAGTGLLAGTVVFMQPWSADVQAGRLGLICLISVGTPADVAGMPMKWISLSPAVETKKSELSGLKAPAMGAVAVVLAEVPFMSVT